MPIDTNTLLEEAHASTKSILLVEDDPYISSFLVEAITQETPYQVMVANDGNAALKLVQHFAPRLFVLDYGLPGMNGIELYDRLHVNQALAPIPAVMITANRNLPQQQIQQRQLIIFQKPFELEAFLTTIDTLLTSS